MSKTIRCFKKGICKKSDADQIIKNGPKNLKNLIEIVCLDWQVPIIRAKFVNRFSAGYYGLYTETYLFGKIIDQLIEVNSIAFHQTLDSRDSFFSREMLIETIYHELAHYIDREVFDGSGHTAQFYEVLEAVRAGNYTDKLEEV